MSSTAMMNKIQSQPQSLKGVLDHHCADGKGALTQAAEILRSRRQVVITAMGASLFAALPLETHLCSLGIDAVAIEAGELLHYRHHAYRDAVMLVISRSGESIEIAKLLAILKGRQPVIGVTNRPASLLSREADVILHIASKDDDIVALQTYTGTLLTLYLLGKTVENSLAAAKSEIETLLPHFSDFVTENLKNLTRWDEFLQRSPFLYLLGRGPSCASAFEGSLLFNEVAKFPAIGMAAASFRHGPAEVVDTGFAGFVFASQGITSHLNVALARDLARFGGHIQLIGPPTDEAYSLPTIEVPAMPELLAPIWEIVPIQAAALRLAELKGFVPGSFRFVPPVALDESSFPNSPDSKTS
jgi:glucosamine--fructose-6-phosphate aminotransferase (isomerizing)